MLVATRASWGIFVLHWKWNHVYFSETTNFHWNKNFIGKCLPDSSQTLLSNEKASRWVGNTDLSSLYPRYAHLALLWRGICWQAQICCPLGCPAQSRAAGAAELCWTGHGTLQGLALHGQAQHGASTARPCLWVCISYMIGHLHFSKGLMWEPQTQPWVLSDVGSRQNNQYCAG